MPTSNGIILGRDQLVLTYRADCLPRAARMRHDVDAGSVAPWLGPYDTERNRDAREPPPDRPTVTHRMVDTPDKVEIGGGSRPGVTRETSDA